MNALVAWRHSRAPHHEKFHAWVARTDAKKMWTCAHVELGFIRVSMQVFGYTLAQAQDALVDMKKQLADSSTRRHRRELATFDAAILDGSGEIIV